MPLTHYHLGAGLLPTAFLKNKAFSIGFLFGTMMPDIEPLIVVLANWNYPYLSYPHHGIVHTLLAGVVFSIFPAILIKEWKKTTFLKNYLSVFLGYCFHILLDSIMHYDVFPFWPLRWNPFLRILSVSDEYSFIYIMSIIGIILLAINYLKKNAKKRSLDATSDTH